MKKKVTVNAGVSFAGLLQVAFIVLKICKVINWGWGWVLAPTWIPATLGLLMLLSIVIIAILTTKK